MKKLKITFYILIVVIISFCVAKIGSDTKELCISANIKNYNSALLESENLDNWTTSKINASTQILENQAGRTTNDAFKIIANEADDAMVTFNLKNLEPNEFYQFSAYVKAEGMIAENEDYGVSIGENGNWASSVQVKKASTWTRVETVIRSSDSGTIKLNARIGFWNALTQGVATFSDIEFEKITDQSETKKIIKSDDGIVRIVFNKDEYEASGASDEKIVKWANNLSIVRDNLEELVGNTVNNGKIDIIATNDYPYAWAFAGDPVQWMVGCAEDSLKSIQTTDEWVFGILHEISHTFDSDSWDFDSEMWANTKMAYVLEKADGMVIMDQTIKYKGANIKQFYQKFYNSDGVSSNDGLTYKLLDIKDKITEETQVDGWEAFKQTFNYFNTLENAPTTKIGKLQLFINKLSEYSGIDVMAEFSNDEISQLATKYEGSLVQDISFDTSSINLEKGKSIKLTPVVEPSDAFNSKLLWSSDNELIARVDNDGNVTGVSTGTVNISVKTSDGTISNSIEVTVFEYEKPRLSLLTNENNSTWRSLATVENCIEIENVSDGLEYQYSINSAEWKDALKKNDKYYVVLENEGVSKIKLKIKNNDWESNEYICKLDNTAPYLDIVEDLSATINIKSCKVEVYDSLSGLASDKVSYIFTNSLNMPVYGYKVAKIDENNNAIITSSELQNGQYYLFMKISDNAGNQKVFSTGPIEINVKDENQEEEDNKQEEEDNKQEEEDNKQDTDDNKQETDISIVNPSEVEKYLFDYKYYADHNLDLYSIYGYDEAALRYHWETSGKIEGRKSSCVFDVKYYVENNPDLAIFKNNYAGAYNHFLNYGYKEYRKSSMEYDGMYYRRNNGDLKNMTSFELIVHYSLYGKNELRKANDNYDIINYLFDPQVYFEMNPDVARVCGNNLELLKLHWCRYGINEGRVASYIFDAKYYVESNRDIKAAFGNNYSLALNHFVVCGFAEGRQGIQIFDTKYYLENNSDVKIAFGDNWLMVLNHFVKAGINETRKTSPTFDVNIYKQNNGDLQNVYANQYKEYFKHYIIWGYSENRVCI